MPTAGWQSPPGELRSAVRHEGAWDTGMRPRAVVEPCRGTPSVLAVPTARWQSLPGSGWAGGNFGRRRVKKVLCTRACGSGPRWNRGARHHRRQPCRRLCEYCRRSPAGLEKFRAISRDEGTNFTEARQRAVATGSASTHTRVRADDSDGAVGRTSSKPDRSGRLRPGCMEKGAAPSQDGM